MKNWKHYLSTITMLMVTRLYRLVTYLKELSPINSHELPQWNGHGNLQWQAAPILKRYEPLIMWDTWDDMTVEKCIFPLSEKDWQTGQTGKRVLSNFSQFLLQKCVNKIGSLHWIHQQTVVPTNCCACVWACHAMCFRDKW